MSCNACWEELPPSSGLHYNDSEIIANMSCKYISCSISLANIFLYDFVNFRSFLRKEAKELLKEERKEADVN